MRLEEQSRRRRSIRESDLVHNNNNNKISDHVASFRITLAMEKEEWKSFPNALDKSEKKKFGEMSQEDKLRRLLKIKQRQKQEAMHIEDTQRLVTEIEMLKVVLYLVSRKSSNSS